MLAEIREFLDRIHKINRMIALSNTIDFRWLMRNGRIGMDSTWLTTSPCLSARTRRFFLNYEF
jgi:hypothetical protein